MNVKLRALLEQKQAKLAKAREITGQAETDERELTDEEQTSFDALMTDIDAINVSVAREERLIEEERTMAAIPGDTPITGGMPAAQHDPCNGFGSFGEYALAVMSASRSGGAVDERLIIGAAAPTTYGNESSGADGGFVVPVEYSNSIFGLSLEGDAFLPMTDNDNVSGNAMSFPADENTPWGSTGIRAYWEAEGALGTQTKPSLKRKDFRLHKLFALVPMTDELISDAATLSGYVPRKAGEAIRWKTNDAIINGTGAGQPSGVAGAAAAVTQAKETSQTAGTVNAQNVVKMFSRSLNPGRAVWLINPDTFPQLPLMSINNQPVFTPPGTGLQNAPAGTLLGRPVMLTDTCQTVGAQGDIQFVDFSGYKTITKAGGVETATSMHLWFDYGINAFRATFRVDGGPMLSAAVSPANGNVKRSHFVNLAARA